MDNSSLYIKAMDGKSPARVQIDNLGMTVSGIAWDKESHLLGVSLVAYDTQAGMVIGFNQIPVKLTGSLA